MFGHAGETSYLGTSYIGTNPSEGELQYSGSVIEKDLVYNVINTALHENIHQLEGLPGGIFSGWDALLERLTEGEKSLAQTIADYIMSKHPELEDVFIKKVKDYEYKKECR